MMIYSVFAPEFENSNEINLNYLNYYLDALSSGLEFPSNYDILKNEITTILCNYVACNDQYPIIQLIKPFMESINNADHGINKHAKCLTEKFNNLATFIKLFQVIPALQKHALSGRINNVLSRTQQIVVLTKNSSPIGYLKA